MPKVLSDLDLICFIWMPTQCDLTVTATEAYFTPLCVFTHILLQLSSITPNIICKFQ